MTDPAGAFPFCAAFPWAQRPAQGAPVRPHRSVAAGRTDVRALDIHTTSALARYTAGTEPCAAMGAARLARNPLNLRRIDISAKY
ncbi:hypothetical protein GCM10017559_64950 [Streptosporangium longisporum]|uniref:Uncharacterized protein n=1 Tax=Streptosporangium longisporum TaxID=46187 RepID=A0ABP6L174_9ACTN